MVPAGQVTSPALLNTPNPTVSHVMTPAPAPTQAPQIFTPSAPAAPTQVYSPAAMHGPHDGDHASLDLGAPQADVREQEQEETPHGFMGWLAGNAFVNKVVEKTKVGLENESHQIISRYINTLMVIHFHVACFYLQTFSENLVTTLDPGMKQVISKYLTWPLLGY